MTDTNRKLQHEGKEVRPVYLLKESLLFPVILFDDCVPDLVACETIGCMLEGVGHYHCFSCLSAVNEYNH